MLWRPGLTIFIAAWGNDKNESESERIGWLKGTMSSEAYDVLEEQEQGLRRLAYRLKEQADDERCPALYCFVVGQHGQVEMGIYFDDESDAQVAKEIWRSLRETVVT